MPILKEEFLEAFAEITDQRNWIDGKPVYKGVKYVTVANALADVFSSKLDQQREEIKKIINDEDELDNYWKVERIRELLKQLKDNGK